MLFNRKKPPDWKEKLRISLWPRRSWSRSAKYVLKRMLRLSGTPHAIALGSAAGVLASFTPYMGLHFLLAAILAWAIRGNVLASALGTFFGNPLTFPLIWLGAYNTGNILLGNTGAMEQSEIMASLGNLSAGVFSGSWASLGEVLVNLWPVLLLPMTVGGIFIGSFVSVAAYFLIYRLVEGYKKPV